MAAKEGHQEHPLGIYWFMWIALFVLSGGSYATDGIDKLLQGITTLDEVVRVIRE